LERLHPVPGKSALEIHNLGNCLDNKISVLNRLGDISKGLSTSRHRLFVFFSNFLFFYKLTEAVLNAGKLLVNKSPRASESLPVCNNQSVLVASRITGGNRVHSRGKSQSKFLNLSNSILLFRSVVLPSYRNTPSPLPFPRNPVHPGY